jgi:hypothetical protein
VGPGLFTRSGVIISAGVHGAAALLVVLFTGANPFDSEATEAISVDIISPAEAPPAPDWTVPADPAIKPPKPQLDLAAFAPHADPAAAAAATGSETGGGDQAGAAGSKAGGGEQAGAAGGAAKRLASPISRQGPGIRQSSTCGGAGPAATNEGPATDGGMGDVQGTEKQTNVANMFSMPLALPDGRLGGAFDAPATEAAEVERTSIDAFRERIKSCATLPAGVSPSDRVSLVVRIALKRDGTLAGQPALIEASASPKGPAVLQSLFAGLAKCQPFNMLPADKYQEWSLDIRFSPQDFGPG